MDYVPFLFYKEKFGNKFTPARQWIPYLFNEIIKRYPLMSPCEYVRLMRDNAWEIFQAIETSVYLSRIRNIKITNKEAVFKIVQSLKQGSKSRAGSEFEIIIEEILKKENHIVNYLHNCKCDKYLILPVKQRVKGDFIFLENGNHILLSIKTTLKER